VVYGGLQSPWLYVPPGRPLWLVPTQLERSGPTKCICPMNQYHVITCLREVMGEKSSHVTNFPPAYAYLKYDKVQYIECVVNARQSAVTFFY
jgi:hypothetical protein